MLRTIANATPTSLEVSGEFDRPAMEESEGSRRLYEAARGIAAELGLELGAARVGGASDGNLTAAAGIPTLLSKLPLNEVLRLQVHEKRLKIPRLPAGSPELRIAHLSDLHMSGRIKPEYFELAVEAVNRLEPDLVAITGDIVDC